jgi:hypothetical protein
MLWNIQPITKKSGYFSSSVTKNMATECVVKLLAIVLYIQMVLSSILSLKNDSPKFFVICRSPFFEMIS